MRLARSHEPPARRLVALPRWAAGKQSRSCSGLVPVLTRLYANGLIGGALAIGGSDGAITAAPAMQALPVGVPKLIVSPATQGKTPFGTFVGTSDMMIMNSVVDLLGIKPDQQARS